MLRRTIKALGAFVIGTAGSANKCAIAKAAGADIAINYSQEDWPSALLEATGGKKAAVVYDSVGKATFLKSLDRNQRDQLDTLLGRLSRAYEMQGFLFGGLASGAKWNGKTAPEPGDGYGRSVRAYHGSTLAPVCQIDRKTNQVIHEYPSIAAASRATGLDDSAIGKVCKGKLPHAGGFLFRYIEQ